MSDDKKKDNKKIGDGQKPETRKYSGGSQERSKTTKEEWSKIDKKGQGAGDRPKK